MDESEDNDTKNSSLNLIADYGSESDSEDTETRSNIGNEDSDAVEHHEMVLKNNIINACAHGPLSNNESPRSDVEITRHMIIDSMEIGVVEYEVSEYRDVDFDSDSDSSSDPSISSDSDVDSVKDVEEISSGDENPKQLVKPETPKSRGELGLDDLPPIEDLAISLPAQQTTKLGTIASIIDRLVIVRAIPESPAVDLDTVLFLESGAKALGKVFDVFGPVTEPHYCVRFNSAEHVRSRGVSTGADVFVAPLTQHTNFVFLTQLMKAKGSDASWLHDIEPPSSQVDYSDDEEERNAAKARKDHRQKQMGPTENGETSKNPFFRKTLEPRRNQRPSESSSRFGSGPSRGRNPFAGGAKRNLNTNRPWTNQPDFRNNLPRPEPNYVYGATFNPSLLQPNFCSPPPFIGNQFPFGMNPRVPPPIPPPFRQPAPAFGVPYCSMPRAQWLTGTPPPPPPGT